MDPKDSASAERVHALRLYYAASMWTRRWLTVVAACCVFVPSGFAQAQSSTSPATSASPPSPKPASQHGNKGTTPSGRRSEKTSTERNSDRVHRPSSQPDKSRSRAKPGRRWGRVKRAMGLYGKAQELYAQGRYAEAYSRLQEAVKLDPKGKELHYNLGLVAEKRGMLTDAIRHYRSCYELEKAPHERRSLRRILRRLEGVARSEIKNNRSLEPLRTPKAAPLLAESEPTGRTALRGFLIGSCALAGVGVGLGAVSYALSSADPIPLDEPGSDARLAEAKVARQLGIGAAIALGLGGVSAAAALVIELRSPEQGEVKASAARSRLSIGPGSLRYRYDF